MSYTQIFENLFPEVFFPFNFAPGKSRISGGMVRISEIQQFPDFLETFREISVPFRKFWLDGKRSVSTDQVYLYLCHELNCQPGSYFKAPLKQSCTQLTNLGSRTLSASPAPTPFL